MVNTCLKKPFSAGIIIAMASVKDGLARYPSGLSFGQFVACTY